MTLTDLPRLRETWSYNSSTASRWASLPLARPNSKMARSSVLSYASTATLLGVGPPCTRPADHRSSSNLPGCTRKTKPSLNASSGTRTTHTKSFTASLDWWSLAVMENFLWYGERALVLSDKGLSLSDVGIEFTSLGLIKRCDSLRFE